MPKIACPACDAITKLPDDAGSTVRCSGCGKKLAIPDRGAKGDEGPKRKKKRKAKKGNPLILWLALGGTALVVLLAACGVGGWYAFIRKDPSVGADGWATLEHDGGVFTASFPGGKPEAASFGKNAPAFAIPDGGGKTFRDVMPSFETWGHTHRGRDYSVMLSSLPQPDAAAVRDAARAGTNPPNSKTLESAEVVANGCKGQRVVRRGDNGRTIVQQVFVIADRRVLIAAVAGDRTMDPNDPDVVKFFERLKPNPDAG